MTNEQIKKKIEADKKVQQLRDARISRETREAASAFSDVSYTKGFGQLYDKTLSGDYELKFENYLGLEGNEDRLAKQQSSWEQVYNGLSKNLMKTGLYAADAINTATYGLYSAVTKGSLQALWDNDVSNYLDDQAKRLDRNFANYYTDEEKSKGFFGRMFTNPANFLANDVAGGLAFIGGAVLPEVALGILTGGTSLAGSGAKLAARTGLRAAFGAADDVAKQVTRKQFKDGFSSLLRAKVGSKAGDALNTAKFVAQSTFFEAGMEARHSFHDSIDNFIKSYEEREGKLPSQDELSKFIGDASNSANGVFTANVALLSITNAAMFGKTFNLPSMDLDTKIGKAFGLNVTKLPNGKMAMTEATKLQKVGGKAYFLAKKPVMEGVVEEGLQGVFGKTMGNYLDAKYDPNQSDVSVLGAFGDALKEQYTTKEGWFEIGIGAIIGMVGGNVSGDFGVEGLGKKGYSGAQKRLEGKVENYNNTTEKALKNLFRANSVMNYNASQEAGIASTPAYQDTVVNYNYIKANESLKGYTNTIEDYNTVVDNYEMTPQEMERLGFTTEEQVASYKEDLKQNFANDYTIYQEVNTIVDSLEVPNYTAGELGEFRDAVTFSLMAGKKAGVESAKIAQILSEITGVGGLYDAMKFSQELDVNFDNNVQTLKEKEARLEELKKEILKIGEDLQGSKGNENLYKENSKKYLIATQELRKLEEETANIEQQLEKDFQAMQAEITFTPQEMQTLGIKDILGKMDSVKEYVDSLKKMGRTKEAKNVENLLNQFNAYSSAEIGAINTMRRMSATDFYSSSEGKGLLGKIRGEKYKMSDEVKKELEASEADVRDILVRNGFEYSNVSEVIEKMIGENSNLSEREKFKVESMLRTILAHKRINEKIEEAQEELETVVEEETLDEGDTIFISKNLRGRDLTNPESINQLIKDITGEIDAIVNKPTAEALREIKAKEQEIEQLRQRIIDLRSGKITSQKSVISKEDFDKLKQQEDFILKRIKSIEDSKDESLEDDYAINDKRTKREKLLEDLNFSLKLIQSQLSQVTPQIKEEYQGQETTQESEEEIDEVINETEQEDDFEAKKDDIERRRQEELNSEKSFEGNRNQAELLRLPGNYLKKGDYVQINNVNISQDTTIPDYRTGKFKILMISVNVNGKDGIVTLSDGNEIITPKISDLINAKYDAELEQLKTQQEIITDEDYTDFVDNGIVSNEIIDSIANKVKDNLPLTERESAIFTDKTSEVNQRIVEINTESEFGSPEMAEKIKKQIDSLTQEEIDEVINEVEATAKALEEKKAEIRNVITRVNERLHNKNEVISIVDFLKEVLPSNIFEKYSNLYDLDIVKNIKYDTEYSFNVAGYFENVRLNIDKFLEEYNSYEDLRDVINHEIIHGVLNSRFETKDSVLMGQEFYDFHKDLKNLIPIILNNRENAPDRIKGIIDYIIRTSEQKFVYKGNPDNNIKTGFLEELITYAFTDKEFAEFLDSIPSSKEINVEGSTIFAQLKNLIREFINSVYKGSSALDEIQEILEKYINPKYKRETTNSTEKEYNKTLEVKKNEIKAKIQGLENQKGEVVKEPTFKGEVQYFRMPDSNGNFKDVHVGKQFEDALTMVKITVNENNPNEGSVEFIGGKNMSLSASNHPDNSISLFTNYADARTTTDSIKTIKKGIVEKTADGWKVVQRPVIVFGEITNEIKNKYLNQQVDNTQEINKLKDELKTLEEQLKTQQNDTTRKNGTDIGGENVTNTDGASREDVAKETVETTQTVDTESDVENQIQALTESIQRLEDEIKDLKTPFKFMDSEGYKRYNQLVAKKDLTNEEQAELENLESSINQWITITGVRVQGIELSDLIKQLQALESTIVETPIETVEATEEEVDEDIKQSEDAVQNNYDVGLSYNAVVSRRTKDSVIISNITVEGLEEATGVAIKDREGLEKTETGGIKLPNYLVDEINQNGKVIIINPAYDESTTYYALVISSMTDLETGVETFRPLSSDFDIEYEDAQINPDTIYEAQKGDEVLFKIDPREPYTAELLNQLRDEMGVSKPLTDEEFKAEVDKLVQSRAQKSKIIEKSQKELADLQAKEFKTSTDGYAIKKLEKRIKDQLKELREKAEEEVLNRKEKKPKKPSEALMTKILNKLRITIIDEQGRNQQIIKGIRETDGYEGTNPHFEAIRVQLTKNPEILLDLIESTNYDTYNLGVKVLKVYAGLPNYIYTKNAEGKLVRQNKPIIKEDLDKIGDIGYVENGKLVLRSGNDDNINVDFIKSSLKKKGNTKTPIIIVTKGNQKIAYPVRVGRNESPINLDTFQSIYDSESISAVDKAIRLNTMLSQAGINIKEKGNAFVVVGDNTLNEEFFNNIFAKLKEKEYIRSVESWSDPKQSISDALLNNATINIKLSDPFISPKIKYDFSMIKVEEVPQTKKKSTKKAVVDGKESVLKQFRCK